MGRILYLIVVGLVFVSGLGVVIYFGIQPRNVPKIDFSQFDHPAQLGEATALRLSQEIKEAPLLLVGVWPGRKDDLEAVDGLLESLRKTGEEYEVRVTEPLLPLTENLPGEHISIKNELARFAEGVKNGLAQGRRILALVPSPFSSQLLVGNPADRLKKEYDLPVVSLSLVPFPLSREEEKKFEIPCETNPGGEESLGALGCSVLQSARGMYRKKKDPVKFSGAVEQVGLHDYLILLALPKNAAP